jgi:hypothetical protein
VANRSRWLLAFTALCFVAVFVVPAIPQPLGYHQFADQRRALGIANFFDVASNVGFLVAGLAGLIIVWGDRARFEFARERWPWTVFFAGLLLTAIGSSYYHLAPDNERLFWDRLPMTIAFAGLVASQIVDRVSVRAGIASLVPLLVAGAASVIYWRWTERMGAGNLAPYGILQGYAVAVLLFLAVAEHSRYSRGNDLYWIFGWYVLGKLFETFDEPVFALGHVASGHTLKHLAAAGSGFVACFMLMHRTLRAHRGPLAAARDRSRPAQA